MVVSAIQQYTSLLIVQLNRVLSSAMFDAHSLRTIFEIADNLSLEGGVNFPS